MKSLRQVWAAAQRTYNKKRRISPPLFLYDPSRLRDAKPTSNPFSESRFQRFITQLHHAGTAADVVRIRSRIVDPSFFNDVINPQLTEPAMLFAYRRGVHLHTHAVIAAQIMHAPCRPQTSIPLNMRKYRSISRFSQFGCRLNQQLIRRLRREFNQHILGLSKRRYPSHPKHIDRFRRIEDL